MNPARDKERLAVRKRAMAWLAIPGRGRARQCLTHAPRKSWKIMVEFFMALNTNIGSWICNLKRRNITLLASMAENIFGFAGTYARKKQASLAPIQTGWKRWLEIHSNKDTNGTMRTGWTLNLQILGSIDTNTVAKAVSWNIGLKGYKGSKEAVHQISE